jgi:outer membrane protein
MWNSKTNFFIIIILLLATLAFSIYSFNKTPKIGYVDLVTVFEKFSMKKEMESKLNETKRVRQLSLDSMIAKVYLPEDSIKSYVKNNPEKLQAFQRNKEMYLTLKERYENDNANQVSDYDNQIKSQLKQYISEYGEKNGYAYVLSDDGSGYVMYAEKTKNVTEEVIQFINDRYEDKK